MNGMIKQGERLSVCIASLILGSLALTPSTKEPHIRVQCSRMVAVPRIVA